MPSCTLALAQAVSTRILAERCVAARRRQRQRGGGSGSSITVAGAAAARRRQWQRGGGSGSAAEAVAAASQRRVWRQRGGGSGSAAETAAARRRQWQQHHSGGCGGSAAEAVAARRMQRRQRIYSQINRHRDRVLPVVTESHARLGTESAGMGRHAASPGGPGVRRDASRRLLLRPSELVPELKIFLLHK